MSGGITALAVQNFATGFVISLPGYQFKLTDGYAGLEFAEILLATKDDYF